MLKLYNMKRFAFPFLVLFFLPSTDSFCQSQHLSAGVLKQLDLAEKDMVSAIS